MSAENTLRIAVVDDTAEDRALLFSLVSAWAESRGVRVHMEEFPSAESFLFAYEDECGYDILLLDIEMRGMDGVTLAKRIRSEDETVQMVFVTGYSDYIAEGYEVAALHYLMKPVREEKFRTVLERAVEKLKKDEACLTLETGEGLLRVPLYRMIYAEVRANYVTVHVRTQNADILTAEHTVKMTLGELERQLDSRFLRIGRSAIINLTAVVRVTKKDVYLKDGTALPLPRGAYEQVNRSIIGL